jgi:general secretion pathway protein A
MYTRFFGLRENPFALPPDPSYLYLGGGDREALAHLRYGIEEGSGFVQLTGEVGTGKTLLVRAAVEKLPENIDVALILYPILSGLEFVKTICDELRVAYPVGTGSLKDLIDGLNAHLLESHAQGRRTVLIIDEAQNLSREVLEQLRLLTNLETTKQKLLQIVLVGQPELDSLLAQHNLRQLAQRITARYRLASLTRAETYNYVLHRCRIAGATSPLFNRASLRWVYILSNGVPRLINIVCDRALLGAYANEQPVVNAGVVRRAAAELDLRMRHQAYNWPRLAAAAGVGALALGAALWYGAMIPPSGSQHPASANAERRSTEAALLAGPAAATSAAGERAERDGNPSPVPLDVLLQRQSATTEAALKDLFARWGVTNPNLSGANACALAQQAGLRCLYRSGTWNNLRNFNRPAIVELIDGHGRLYHVLIAALGAESVTIELAGQRHVVALTEIERLWFGGYMLLWRARMLEQGILRRGMQGPAVLNLRAVLAAYKGEPAAATASDRFDEALEQRVKDFQRAHRITPDGVVGELTALYLSSHERDATLPSLARAGTH